MLVVPEIEHGANVLLSWPFLSQKDFKFKVNCETEKISFSTFPPISYVQSDIPLPHHSMISPCEIRTTHKITLAPRTEAFVKFNHSHLCHYLKSNKFSSTFISPSSTLMGTPLRLGTGQVSKDNRQLLLSNWSSVAITLEKGALIGLASNDTYKIFSLESDDSSLDGIDDSNIYLPSPILNDFNNLTDEPNRVLSQKEFLVILQSLLDKNKINNNNINKNNTTNSDTTNANKQDNNNNLTNAQRSRLINFLVKWRHLFSKDPKNPGATTKTACRVVTDPPDLDPIRCHPYRIPFRGMEELRKQVTEMLASGIARKSKSAWAFPVVLALKSDGSWRFCVDYSKLNKHVPRDSFPLPNIDDHLDRLGKAKIFTVIDLASGFWQIPVEEKDKEKLAFITPFGTYEWNFMPFGYVNAPSIFQRAISETLDPALYLCCLVYVDDIIIYSDSFDTHLDDLNKVFELLDKFHWRVKLTKCQFAKEEIEYLGHEVSRGHIQPLDRNIQKLQSMKVPTNQKELVSFLGVTAYYKRFICGYDYLIKPLRDLTKPSAKWNFSPDSPAFLSYSQLLELFSTQPILRLPDFSRPFIVKSDCSSFAWGASLVQIYDNVEHPVQFASGTLNSSQRNWPAWKRELYGSLRAILKWNHYLYGTKFTLITDHKANIVLLDPLKKHPPIIKNWIILLSPYKFDIVHRAGKSLYIEDALSRSLSLFSISIFSNSNNDNLVDIHRIIKAQATDSILSDIIKHISLSAPFPPELVKKLHLSTDHFSLEENVLYYLENISKFPSRRLKRLALPAESHETIFKLLHDHELSGHLGFERFWTSVSNTYWYPNLYNISKSYYDKCHTCNLNKPLKHHNSQISPILPICPFDILQVDHIIVNAFSKDPLTYKYILVITDTFTKKAWFLPTKSLTAQETFDLLFIHVFSPFFFPRHFNSDLGSSFDNDLSLLLMKATNVSHRFALVDEKGTTGQVENRNKLAEAILRKYVNQLTQEDWPKYCWTALHAYNKSINSVHGFSPDYVLYGMKPFTPLDLAFSSYPEYNNMNVEVKYRLSILEKSWKTVTLALSEQAEQMQQNRLNYFHNHPIPTFSPSNLIILKRLSHDKKLNKKLLSLNVGPYEVVSVDNNNVTIQLTPLETLVVHQDDVELYKGDHKPFPPYSFTPLPSEIIPISIPERKKKVDEKKMPDRMKKDLNLKTIVGRRISFYWPSAKRFYDATVIGYNADLTHNLLFFDEPTPDVPPSCDYYKGFLFTSATTAKVERWSLTHHSM